MALLTRARRIVPELTACLHKGRMGKVGVVGGSLEYTGAPYFAGISALRVGCDLAHVFCTEEAATAIKSYAPDLIVHPLLKTSSGIERPFTDNEIKEIVDPVRVWEIAPWLARMDSLVVGPGLGRDPLVLSCVRRILVEARHRNIPIVLDGDGTYVVQTTPDLIRGYQWAVVTPNVNEMMRLYQTLCQDVLPETDPDHGEVDAEEVAVDDGRARMVVALAKSLGSVTVVQKGPVDLISNGESVLLCRVKGSNRRCGGQGDILSGSIGTFLHWARLREAALKEVGLPAVPTAALASCALVRRCNALAYRKCGRSTVCTDMVHCVGESFRILFEQEHTSSL